MEKNEKKTIKKIKSIYINLLKIYKKNKVILKKNCITSNKYIGNSRHRYSERSKKSTNCTGFKTK